VLNREEAGGKRNEKTTIPVQ